MDVWKNVTEERIRGFRISSVFGRQHYNEIVVGFGGPRFGEKLEVNL